MPNKPADDIKATIREDTEMVQAPLASHEKGTKSRKPTKREPAKIPKSMQHHTSGSVDHGLLAMIAEEVMKNMEMEMEKKRNEGGEGTDMSKAKEEKNEWGFQESH